MQQLNNTLAPAKPAAKTDIVTYESNGESISLSIGKIKKYLVAGNGNVSDEEAVMFLSLCRYQHLNPFLREAYLIKYGEKSPATMVTGKDVFLKRAQRNATFDGLQAGIIAQTQNGDIVEREGTFYNPGMETLVGAWAKVFIKGRRIPFYESVALNEYIGRKRDGEVTEQWLKRPATMIRKVAMVHALREAFPEELGALYAQEEIGGASEIVLDEAPVRIDEPEPVYAEPPQQAYEPVYAAEQPQPAYEQAAFFPGDAPAASGPAAALFGN